MFCKYCGKELGDNVMFCGACGNPVSEAAEKEPTALENEDSGKAATENPAGETINPTDEVQSENTPNPSYFEQPQAEAPAKKPPKKLIAVVCAAAAVVLAVALVATTCFDAIKGFFVSTFASDADYLKYVENKALGAVTDEISNGYGIGLENLDASSASEVSLKLNVGEKAASLMEDSLESYSGYEIDLDWLDDVSFDMNTSVKNNIERVAAALNVDGEALVDMDLIMDMDNGAVFIAMLSLSDKYLKSEVSFEEEQAEVMEVYTDPEFEKLLPEESEFDQLIDKYIEIVIDHLSDVEKSSEVLEISGIEQKLTALEIEIDEQDVIDIAEDILETVKDDEQIKKYIEDIAEYLEQKDLVTNADDAYDEFCYLVDDAIESVKEVEVYDTNAVSLVDYVNNSHEIVGRKLSFDGEDILHYATVRDGAKFAFEFEAEGLIINGEGTEKRNTVNAEYAIKYYDEKVCNIIVSDFKTESDYLNGKLRIEPSSNLFDYIGLDSSVSTALSVADPALELNFDNKKDAINFDINLVSGEEVFVGFTVTTNKTSASNVKLPKSENVYTQDEISQWVESMDFDGLLDKLEDLGIPSEIISDMKESLSQPYDYSYDDYDDYYYDDDYDYDYDYDFDYDDDYSSDYDYGFGYDDDYSSDYYYGF